MAQSVHVTASSSASTTKKLPLSRSSHQLRLTTPPVTTSATTNRRVNEAMFETAPIFSFSSSSRLPLVLQLFQHPLANLERHQPMNLRQPNHRPTVQNFQHRPANHRLCPLVQNLLHNVLL